MAALDQAITQLYGCSLLRSESEGSVHHLFTGYHSARQPQERFLFKLLQLPAFLYVSEAILERKVAQYGALLPRLHIAPLDRNFQTNTYLLRSPYNIIPLSSYLQIKTDCAEPLDIEFFLKFLRFLTRAYKTMETKRLPAFNITQVGITETSDFLLYDPSLYFSGHPTLPQDYHFGSWLRQTIKEILQLPAEPCPEKEEQILNRKFGNNLHLVRPILQYLRSGNAELQAIENQLSAKSRLSEETTTQSGSFAEVHELAERIQKEKVNARKLSFRKMGKLGKVIVVFILLAALAGVGYFCFRFLNRSVMCQEGEYVDASRQCMSCFSGCIRCSDSKPNSCQRCDLNMYLVLDEQEDKEGFCLSECRGKLINAGVCVREKQPREINYEAILRVPAPQPAKHSTL